MRRSILFVLCITGGPLAAQDLPAQVDVSCAEGTASLSLQGGGGTLRYSGAEMPMARVRTASGVKLEAVDDPETFAWTKGDEAQLRIAGADLTDCEIASAAQVIGETWTLASLEDADATDFGVEFIFGADGSLSGTAGCNSFTGTWALEEGMVEVGPLAATRKACDGAVMAREATILELFSELTDLRFGADGSLHLVADDVLRATAVH